MGKNVAKGLDHSEMFPPPKLTPPTKIPSVLSPLSNPFQLSEQLMHTLMLKLSQCTNSQQYNHLLITYSYQAPDRSLTYNTKSL